MKNSNKKLHIAKINERLATISLDGYDDLFYFKLVRGFKTDYTELKRVTGSVLGLVFYQGLILSVEVYAGQSILTIDNVFDVVYWFFDGLFYCNVSDDYNDTDPLVHKVREEIVKSLRNNKQPDFVEWFYDDVKDYITDEGF